MNEFILASMLSAMATGVGAIPAIFLARATHLAKDILIAFSAGMMVAASTFELVPESLSLGNMNTVFIGILIGVVTLSVLEQNIPHIHVDHTGNYQRSVKLERRTLLIIIAITLHNIPEGLSVGVSYASEVEGLGLLIAFAIGLQNAPEGFIIALFLVQQHVHKGKAVIIATMTGGLEFVAALIGYWLTSIVVQLIPLGLAFAAGSMFYIVYKELIPESHGDGHAVSATYSFVIGLLVMLYLTTVF